MKKFVVPFFVCVLFLAGCGGGGVPGVPGAGGSVPGVGSVGNPASDSVGKEIGEQMAEEMLGGIDLEYVEEGSGEVVPWPEQMPSDVPVFKYGKIDATMASPNGEDDKSVVLQFREVEEGAYDKYEQDLTSAGWVVTTNEASTDEGIMGHMTAEKDGFRTVDIDMDPMGENTAFLYYMEY